MRKYPYLIECPFEGLTPISVSLVEDACDHAENNVNILDIQPTDGVKKRFGVCSKRVRFEDRNFAIRFIEWMHMMRILGAEKVHFFYDYVHPDMFKIIQYFEEKGLLQTWQFLNPSGIKSSNMRDWQGFLLEVTVLTDCFYQVKNLYDYVAILDFDELIMPLMEEDMTWEDIIKRVDAQDYIDAYVSQNVYYPDTSKNSIETIPNYMHMLQHVQRSKNISLPGSAVKSLFGTERVLTVHNHMPQHCIAEKEHGCKYFDFPLNISQNSHYRNEVEKEFLTTREDKTIWKYKDRLLKDVQETLAATGFAP